MMPVVALALWATGGAHSYLQPVLLFTALFIAYFFPPRLAWPLVALFCARLLQPAALRRPGDELGYPARGVLFLVAVAGPGPHGALPQATACCRPRPSSAAWPSAIR